MEKIEDGQERKKWRTLCFHKYSPKLSRGFSAGATEDTRAKVARFLPSGMFCGNGGNEKSTRMMISYGRRWIKAKERRENRAIQGRRGLCSRNYSFIRLLVGSFILQTYIEL